MPRVAKPFLHRGHWITTVGGRQTKLATAGEGEAIARVRLAAFLDERAADRPPPAAGKTVRELADLYLAHAAVYYRGSAEAKQLKYSVSAVADAGPDIPADAVDRAAVRTLRDQWIADGLTRGGVNRRISQIKRWFKWAAGEGFVSDDTAARISLFSPLPAGRSAAREPEPKHPVEVATVRATWERLCEPWRSLVAVGWHTGARPGELVSLRVGELRTDGRGWWIDKGDQHKTAHKGRDRRIPLPEPAMRALAPWLLRAAVHGCDTVFPSERGRRADRPRHVDPQSYRDAVADVCRENGIPHWHPNQLRHAFASRLRAAGGRFDLDDIREGLSHAKTDMTDHYAKVSAGRIADLAAKLS